MTETLPNGLISNSDLFSFGLRNSDHIDIEDVARLWRVYTANKSTLLEDSGRRLENLFWRIWSSGRISCTIQGSTLARLFLQISEHSSIKEKYFEKRRKNIGTHSGATPHGFSVENSIPKSPPSYGTSNPGSKRITSHMVRTQLPPSILKKPRSSFDEVPGSSGILSHSSIERGATESLSSGSYHSQAGSAGSPNTRRKKTTFAVNLTSSQEESPVYTKKPKPHYLDFPDLASTAHLKLPPRSDPSSNQSQSSSPKTSNKPSQRQQLQEEREEEEKEESSLIAEKTLQSEPSAEEPQPPPPPPEPPTTAPAKTTTTLVEKDFRSRFVQNNPKMPRVSSLTNLIDEYSHVESETPPFPSSISPSESSSSSSSYYEQRQRKQKKKQKTEQSPRTPKSSRLCERAKN